MPSRMTDTNFREYTLFSCFRSLVFNQHKRNLFASSSGASLPAPPPTCTLTPSLHHLCTPPFAYNAHTFTNTYARASMHKRLLEAYPTVVDLKMYSANPISEQRVNYYTMEVNEITCLRDKGGRCNYITKIWEKNNNKW